MRRNVWSPWLGGLLCVFGASCDSSSDAEPSKSDAAAHSAGSKSHHKQDAATKPTDVEADVPEVRDASRATERADAATSTTARDAASGAPSSPAPDDGGTEPSEPRGACAARAVSGMPGVHFHHVHFNTTDPAADIAFFEKYFNTKTVDFCTPAGQKPTRATETERGYFLYTKVATAADPRLNTYLEHVGWIHPDPNAELMRLAGIGAPRDQMIARAQCETAIAGTMACQNYWFYLQAPSGARIEVAKGPGPALMGFGHVHFIMGFDFPFLATATNGALTNKVVDQVNHTDVALEEDTLAMETVVETRGKPIDHLGYSTIDLDVEKDRIVAAGLTLAEDISFKPEYGFRSFFLKSEKGVWIEIVEDTPFAPAQ